MDLVFKRYVPGDPRSFLIKYLDTVLGHSVNEVVWTWEFERLPDQTVFTYLLDGSKIVATQSMLPINLRLNNKSSQTAKSESSFLDSEYRGKGLFEKLYNFAIDQAKMSGANMIWGFTPAEKVWRKNLKFETFDCMITSSLRLSGGSFRDIRHKSSSSLKALLKYLLLKSKSFRTRYKILIQANGRENFTTTSELDWKKIKFMYDSIIAKHPEIICLQLDPEYLSWRIVNNPNLKYDYLGICSDDNTLIGHCIYSKRDGVVSISELTCVEKKDILPVLLLLVRQFMISGINEIIYWGNSGNNLNAAIFEVFKALGATERGDINMKFVLKNLNSSYENKSILDVNNWYLNGLWTEGFFI